MLILPAIDLQNGEAVRLVQGDYGRKTVYNKNPVEQAFLFQEMGAEYLHLVDLDGAKSGEPVNHKVITKIRKRVHIPIQLGGGIRTAETVSFYLNETGVNRVILGSIIIKNPGFLQEMIDEHGPEKIVAGIDARKGLVSGGGWLENSNIPYLDLLEKMKEMGLKYTVVTDISRDGTLTSPNWEMYEPIKGLDVIVSGGVSCGEDIEKAGNYYGIIIGKAYYEGRVDLQKWLGKK